MVKANSKYATHRQSSTVLVPPPKRHNAWIKPKDKMLRSKLIKSTLAASGKITNAEFSTLFLGHSFVRGWKYAVLQRHPHINQGGRSNPTDNFASYRDVTQDLQSQSRILVEELRVSRTYRRMYTMSKIPSNIRNLMRHPQHCVVFISDLMYLVSSIKSMTPPPDSIIVAAGSNDLAGLPHNFNLTHIRDIAQKLLEFVAQIPPRIIVVSLDVIPRAGGLPQISPGQFRYAMREFNNMLQTFEQDALDGKPGVPRNFRHGKLRGWDKTQLPSGEQPDLEVMSWSNPKLIHPTDENYVTKFSDSLRRVLITPKNRPTYVHHN